MLHVAGLYDVITGPALVIGGALAAGIAMGIALVSETVVLLLLRWAGFLRSLRDAFLANLASGIVGVVLAVLFASPLLELDTPWPVAVGSLALSVAIEGALLQWLGRDQTRWRPWIVALVMNIVSYGLFFVLGAAMGSL